MVLVGIKNSASEFYRRRNFDHVVRAFHSAADFGELVVHCGNTIGLFDSPAGDASKDCRTFAHRCHGGKRHRCIRNRTNIGLQTVQFMTVAARTGLDPVLSAGHRGAHLHKIFDEGRIALDAVGSDTVNFEGTDERTESQEV